jgi:hypothetical protein
VIGRILFDTFNVSNIGAAQQYRGFSVFNKIGASVWALTGTGAQNWNISGGTLIGDTNSLQGPQSPTTPSWFSTRASPGPMPAASGEAAP